MKFTQRKELEAVEIGRRFEETFDARPYDGRISRDARIWNNPRWMFDDPKKGGVALVGVHIGGAPGVVGAPYDGPDEDWHRCNRVLTPGEPCNEWVCGKWDDEGTKAQTAVSNVFNSLFGPDRGMKVLLETPSFDACPVRVPEERDIRIVWDCSKPWFYSILEHLEPSLIICVLNVEPRRTGKSAWGALLENQSFRVQPKHPYAHIHGKGYLKHGEITSGTLSGAKVIGVPQLTRWGREPLWSKLVQLGTELGLR